MAVDNALGACQAKLTAQTRLEGKRTTGSVVDDTALNQKLRSSGITQTWQEYLWGAINDLNARETRIEQEIEAVRMGPPSNLNEQKWWHQEGYFGYSKSHGVWNYGSKIKPGIKG